MQRRFSPLVVAFLFVAFTGTSAAEKPLLTLFKRTAPARTVDIAGQIVTSPGYDYGVIDLHNRLSVPITLGWNIEADQNFIPVVRDAAGQVVSNGSPFGFARAPRLEMEEHTVPPREDFTVEAHWLFETVPKEHQKPGSYSIRVQFAVGKSLWESNEIRVELEE